MCACAQEGQRYPGVPQEKHCQQWPRGDHHPLPGLDEECCVQVCVQDMEFLEWAQQKAVTRKGWGTWACSALRRDNWGRTSSMSVSTWRESVMGMDQAMLSSTQQQQERQCVETDCLYSVQTAVCTLLCIERHHKSRMIFWEDNKRVSQNVLVDLFQQQLNF